MLLGNYSLGSISNQEEAVQTFVSFWWLWLVLAIAGFGTFITAAVMNFRSSEITKYLLPGILGAFCGSAGSLCLVAIFLLKLAGRI